MNKTVTAREVAIRILFDIVYQGAYANIALNRGLRRVNLDQRDKKFTTNLVYGNLEKWQPVTFQLSRFLKKPLKDKDKLLALILRNAVYEILYCQTPPPAAVNESVKLAGQIGHQGWRSLANGLLRNFVRNLDNLTWPDFADDISAASFHYSLPGWIGDMWRQERGDDDAVKLIQSLGRHLPLSIRANTLKNSRQALSAALADINIITEESIYAPDCLLVKEGDKIIDNNLFNDGYYSIQGVGSQLAVLALSPQNSEMILDLCAAPGGKTTYIAELSGDKSMITACDIHEHKIKLIENYSKRLGLKSIKAIEKDGVLYGREHPCAFDRVLLDAPCSGLGVLSQRPDALLRKQSEDIEKLSALERGLIDSAVACLKPGGRMVYSTCTLSRRENLDNRDYLLRTYPEMRSVSLIDELPGFDSEDRKSLENGYIELLPYKHGTDGFFIAAFAKEE